MTLNCGTCHYFSDDKTSNDYGYCNFTKSSIYDSIPCEGYLNSELSINRIILFSDAETAIGRYMDYMAEMIRAVHLSPGADSNFEKVLGRCWVELINIGMVWTDKEWE